jgi:recombination protein RecA
MDNELKGILAKINKDFGDGTIMSLSEMNETKIECIPTDSVSLDIALGGGIPKGRIIEIIGHESSGKTTIALHLCKNVQKDGGLVAFIDVEHALDPEWAERIGVDLSSVYISQPSSGEEALQIAGLLIDSGKFQLVIIDSVAALVPKKELENEIGDQTMGLQARLMSQALRVLNPSVSKTNTCLIFINQYRQKIGVLYGNPDVGCGGLALKFYASVRIDTRATSETVKDDSGNITAKGVKAKIIKNKVAPPFRVAEFNINYECGIDSNLDLIKNAVDYGVVEKSSSWYSYKGQKIGQGEDAAVEYIKNRPIIKESIYSEVIEKSKSSNKQQQDE